MFLKVDFLMFLLVAFMLMGQYVEVSKCAMYLGHSISSGDRTEIVKYAKISFWSSFNIFRADFGHISSQLKNVLFQKYCCVLYVLITLVVFRRCYDSVIMCGLRKVLRYVWSVNNRTHCDIITSLSNQFPLILRLKKRFIEFISNCLVSQNNIVKLFPMLPFVTQCLTQVAIIDQYE